MNKKGKKKLYFDKGNLIQLFYNPLEEMVSNSEVIKLSSGFNESDAKRVMKINLASLVHFVALKKSEIKRFRINDVLGATIIGEKNCAAVVSYTEKPEDSKYYEINIEYIANGFSASKIESYFEEQEARVVRNFMKEAMKKRK